MNCSHTIRPFRSVFKAGGSSFCARQYRRSAIVAYLKALATPEPSNEVEPVLALPTGRVFGALKTSLWASAAVGLGVLLATLCN
jgi:hypothetical protein